MAKAPGHGHGSGPKLMGREGSGYRVWDVGYRVTGYWVVGIGYRVLGILILSNTLDARWVGGFILY